MQHQNFQVSVLNLFQMLEFFHKKKLLFTFMDILHFRQRNEYE